MPIYLLVRTDSVDWEENDSVVVRASSEEAARELAAKHSAFEGPSPWLSPSKSTCEVVTVDGEDEVVLASYKAG